MKWDRRRKKQSTGQSSSSSIPHQYYQAASSLGSRPLSPNQHTQPHPSSDIVNYTSWQGVILRLRAGEQQQQQERKSPTKEEGERKRRKKRKRSGVESESSSGHSARSRGCSLCRELTGERASGLRWRAPSLGRLSFLTRVVDLKQFLYNRDSRDSGSGFPFFFVTDLRLALLSKPKKLAIYSWRWRWRLSYAPALYAICYL